jgi:hypothetical protein
MISRKIETGEWGDGTVDWLALPTGSIVLQVGPPSTASSPRLTLQLSLSHDTPVIQLQEPE